MTDILGMQYSLCSCALCSGLSSSLQVDAETSDGSASADANTGTSSYSAYGWRWGGMADVGKTAQVTWSFAASNYSNQPGGDYDTALTSAQKDATRAALARWEQACRIDFVEAGADSASVDIRFGIDAIDGRNRTLAQCGYVYNGTDFVRAFIRFDSAESWNNSLPGTDTSGSYSFYTVALHEIGHAIGLAHSSASPSLMAPIYNPSLDDLQSDDIAGGVYLYGAATTTTSTPATTVPTTTSGGGSDSPPPSPPPLPPPPPPPVLPPASVPEPEAPTEEGNRVAGTDEPDVARGQTGSDTLTGGGGADTMCGATGSDIVFGNAGNDMLFGNLGADQLFGGRDNDVLFGGRNNDALWGDDGGDVILGDPGDDTVTGGGDSDALSGGDGVDQIFGNTGNDLLFGNMGGDILFGGVGDDTLYSGLDGDALFGDDGHDRLSGDAGNDTLSGGAGADVFAFASSGGADVVSDFSFADGDRIGLGSGLGSYTVRANGAGNAVVAFSDTDTLTLSSIRPDQVRSDWFIVA